MKITKCKACGTEIVFLKTKNEKSIPVDATTVKEGDTEYDHTRHTAHFATCQFAKEFRRKR
jgi:hypothetical protein